MVSLIPYLCDDFYFCDSLCIYVCVYILIYINTIFTSTSFRQKIIFTALPLALSHKHIILEGFFCLYRCIEVFLILS